MNTDSKTYHCKSRAMAYPLLGVSEQKPEGKMTDGYAEAAVDISRQVSMSTRSRDRSSDFPTSRLPTEIYQMIVEHIVLHFDECDNDQVAIRAKTLSSLACTSTTLQCLTEPYLYSFPESSRLTSSQGQEHFRLSLAVDSRRGNLVQVLDFVWDAKVYSRTLVIDIARRCPNLHTLHLSFPTKASPEDVFSQAYVDNLADLFFVCPKVKKLRLSTSHSPSTYETEVIPIPEQDGRIAEFAGQLSHVELSDGVAWFKMAMLPYLSRNVISFVVVNPGPEYHPGFLETLGQRCPVLQSLKIMCWGVTPLELETLCKALGSTLKVLYLKGLYADSVLSRFLPNMQVLEHLRLGNPFPLYVEDMDAMSSLSHLRTFIADGDEDEEFNSYFLEETGADRDRALARFLYARRMTLETVWLDSDDLLNKDVFENLKLVRNLGSVGLSWSDTLEREEVEGLLEACPKLQEVSDIRKCVDDMLDGDGWNRYKLRINYLRPRWCELDFPYCSAGWSDSLR
ncbi:hypothetical protein FGLOB1_10832 [Fusarium globosum]|uniref:F-box protein n=1 Tax=Fusarium globosum TaxID=78864 RepID=A0A8H5XUS4_9HYPO|nr:hypothetical protein FGLOB1_10832 [Fusarium globosum]